MSRGLSTPIPPSRAATARILAPAASLTLIRGGRNQPSLVTVPKGELDELRMEVQALQDEALQLALELLPIARRLEFYATHDGSPGAWHLAAALADRLTKYARRHEPRGAA